MTIFFILIIISIGICVGTLFLLITSSTDGEGIIVFASVGVCLACVPFFISLSVKNKAKFICGLPYSNFANGTLILQDGMLTYMFWKVGPTEPAAYSSKRAVYNDDDKFLYVISKSDISSFSIKDDICTIKGNGKFQMPEYASEDATVNSDSAKNFSFILAFRENNAEQIIKEWMN